MDWLTLLLREAGLVLLGPAPPPAGDVTGEVWTDHDREVVRLIYEVLVEERDCARCGAPLRPAVSARVVAGPFAPPRFVVTARCRTWRRHRHVAEVAHERGGLRLGAIHPAR